MALAPVEGEFCHPNLERNHNDSLGFHYRCSNGVPEGTVLVRSIGLQSRDQHALLTLIEGRGACWQGASTWDRCLQGCCPHDMAHCPPSLREKLERDSDNHQTLASAANNAWAEVTSTSSTDLLTTTPEELCLLQAKIDMNSFDEGVFPLACLFNHSCTPSCHVSITSTGDGDRINLLEVRTITEHAEGFMPTICYLSTAERLLPLSQRRMLLETKYHFVCACARCESESNAPSDNDQSDLVAVLYSALSNSQEARDYKTSATTLFDGLAACAALGDDHWLVIIAVQSLKTAIQHMASENCTPQHLLWLVQAETSLLAALKRISFPNDSALAINHQEITEGWQALGTVLEGAAHRDLAFQLLPVGVQPPLPLSVEHCRDEAAYHEKAMIAIRSTCGWL